MANPIRDSMIIDRTIDDVVYVQNLAQKINAGTATAAEITAFATAALRGSYDYSDFNRINHALNYIGLALAELTGDQSYDFDLPTTLTGVDYIVEGSDLYDMLTAVERVKEYFGLVEAIPSRFRRLDYNGANRIERVLFRAAQELFSERYPYPYDLLYEDGDDILAEDGDNLTTED